MRPSRSFLAIVGTCALLLLPASVSAQSTDQAPMLEDQPMQAPAMDATPDMQAMPAADASPSMDGDPAMMTDNGAMPAGSMPEMEPAP
jgi:hypothetical protein